jgi:hypothetical protein
VQSINIDDPTGDSAGDESTARLSYIWPGGLAKAGKQSVCCHYWFTKCQERTAEPAGALRFRKKKIQQNLSPEHLRLGDQHGKLGTSIARHPQQPLQHVSLFVREGGWFRWNQLPVHNSVTFSRSVVFEKEPRAL